VNELKLTGVDGFSPVITTGLDKVISEGEDLSLMDFDDQNSGLDEDGDGDPITYSCFYDTTINESVSNSTDCSNLGIFFSSESGSLSWTPDYSQSGVYELKVTATSKSGSDSTVFSITVNNANEPPVASDLSPASFDEETESIIALSYVDGESEDATSCSVSGFVNTTESTPCACATGTCTVGITGNLNFFGTENLSYAVSNAQTSNSANLNLTIDNVNDAPVISDITNQTTSEDTATSSIAFTINDPDLSLSLSCSSSVSMSSSNATLINDSDVVFSGTAPNCQAVLSPNANENGTSTITFTLSDGSLSNLSSAFSPRSTRRLRSF
jgi:hypothetical protein